MQTFVIHEDIRESFKMLDTIRLRCQIKECTQILDILEGRKFNNWAKHPATEMWRGHAPALRFYANCAVDEYKRRGFNTSIYFDNFSETLPEWTKHPLVIMTHRSNLLRKGVENYETELHKEIKRSLKPKYKRSKIIDIYRNNLINYLSYNWNVPNHFDYFWPTRSKELIIRY